ncbi:tRNA (cytidine(34)-2'-O)-methyltransferase [Paroceanicella profunda]|uniref:tRNA (cytidine(34)-2'-O)-methyltransferase n=1 Tax=Paroceanicella profunda TaxID=2579971 RepID=A0A5B8FXU5_9RHOB|nr:TrmH family RNA methyltransferase [Paroceanicella profunda]QDL92100.1 tRNA (cytidine(34)-2'-O)-methyltransferase [Paroceanicella profunda]
MGIRKRETDFTSINCAPLRLASYQPDIPQNLGGMIRLAACFGIALDVIAPCGFPFSTRDVRVSSLDYAKHAEILHHASWSRFQESCTGRVIAMTTAGATPLWGFAFRPGDVILMGRESAGLPGEVHAAATARLCIPMPGGGRSLNVVTAAAIAVAEAQRQFATA